MADKIKLFGRSYNQIGSSDADMIIKTKGQLKLQYGNKFIDLIKDGKLNVNSEFIFKAKSLDDITRNDGIYICEDGSIYLKVGDSVINLVGEVGTTYVAFLEEQETTPDQKHQALVNIGFLHETLDSVDSNSLRNGIIYVESEQKLYTIVDGTVTELVVNFPIPFTSQFVVAKTSSEKGAILIKGQGIENSLAFESMFVYVDGDNTNFDSDNNIIFRIGGTEVLSLSMIQALFSMPVVSSMFKSPEANSQTGFRLYVEGGKSYLEVDNLIVRQSSDDSSSLRLFPEYWLLKNNIIKKASFTAIGEDQVSQNILSVELAQDNEFVVGDIVVFYKKSEGKISLGMADVDVYDEDGNVIGTEQEEQFKEIETYSRVEAEVTEISDISITIKCFSDDLSSDEIAALSNQFIYLIKSQTDLPIRIKDNNIDIVEYSGENGALTPEVKTRVGKLDDLNLTTWNKGESEQVAGHGFYSDNSAFKKAQYTEEVDLPEDDDSYKFASTHWVNKKVASLNIDADLTINENEDSLDIAGYFSRPEIQQLLQDQEVGTVVSYLGRFGVITIAKSERNYTFSAIVRAVTDGQKWSHRSINGTYDSLTGTWYGTSTFIIKDQFNPGYYWAKELKNSKPVSPEYIGTTNTETVSKDVPYILYTNDGKTWKLIDEYIAPNQDLVYFSASGSAACKLPNAQAVPMGFIGIVKADGTTQVNIGKSNYATDTFDKDNPETGDVRGEIPKATRELLINTLKDAQPGVIPSIPGLPTSFFIRKEDIGTIPENSIHKLKSSEGGLDLNTVFGDAKIEVRNIIQSLCRWTNQAGQKYNTTHPGTYKSVGDIEFWKNDLNIRALAGAILCEIFQSVPNVSATEARDAAYSDTVGFAQSWAASHWENFDFFQMTGVCESSFAKPTDDENNAKAGLKMGNNISIVCGSAHIHGGFHVTYRDYKWPESPDANYPYLSAKWAIDDMSSVSEIYRLPYPVDVSLDLVFNSTDGNYKIQGIVGKGLSVTAI